jgi:serpin B
MNFEATISDFSVLYLYQTHQDMKSLLFSLAIVLLITATSCKKESQEGPKQPKPIDLPDKSNDVISKSNSFGIDLFRVTAQAEEDNIMLSPLSASIALTMLLNGCNGETYNQIRDMMGYEGLTLTEINAAYNSLVTQLLAVDPEVELALANAVWYRQDFTVKPDYLTAMDQSFNARIEALDFLSPSALETINGWASDNTNGKIKEVLKEISPDAVMFLQNALYFKGTWTYKFKEDQTGNAPFYLENGNTTDVKMMQSLIPVKIFSTNHATAVELPYGQQNFSMVVIVPVNALSNYLAEFDPAEWESIVAGIDAIDEPVETQMMLPKFKFDYEKYLNDQLQALGMIDAFNPGAADLSGISDASIFVSFVKQNTFVEVNEEGTEAAAVTTIGIEYTSVPGTFTVDKPFIFAIRERMTNSLLFIGKVENPEYE